MRAEGEPRRRRDRRRVDASPARIALEQGRRDDVLDRRRGVQPARDRPAVRLRMGEGDGPLVAFGLLRRPEPLRAARRLPPRRRGPLRRPASSARRWGARSTRSTCPWALEGAVRLSDFDTKLYAGGEEATVWKKEERDILVTGGTPPVARSRRRRAPRRLRRVERREASRGRPRPAAAPGAGAPDVPLPLGGPRAGRVRTGSRGGSSTRSTGTRTSTSRRADALELGFSPPVGEAQSAGRALVSGSVGDAAPVGVRARHGHGVDASLRAESRTPGSRRARGPTC